MTGLFSTVLNMSLTASYVALIVIFVRLILKRAPKIFSYALWSVVLFRLVCPVSFKSVLSLIPNKADAIINNAVYSGNLPAGSVLGIVNNALSTAVSHTLPAVTSAAGMSPLEIVMEISTLIWLAGIAVLLLYGAFSYFRLKHQLSASTLITNNIFETDRILTPFVFGFIKPRIYIPTGLSEKELAYILKHEQTHIRRLDHLIKQAAFLVLVLHWFNPLMWVCYFLMVKDMEMSCDESVMRQSGEDIRRSYSNSLLSLSVKQSGLSSSLTFGERHVKSRIKNVLSYKKPAFWVIAAAVIAVVTVAVGLMMNPKVNAADLLSINKVKTESQITNEGTSSNGVSSSAINSSEVSSNGTSSNYQAGPNDYENTQYGFIFSLPQDWNGYRTGTDEWQGLNSQSGKTVDTGPIILIRNPLWTSQNPRQDIPIMIFTLAQWDSLQNGDFHIGAAPIGPTELGRNSKYVFALPARYDYAFLPGYKEVENILAGKPLHPIEDFSSASQTTGKATSPSAVSYTNSQYGYIFSLPVNWKDYKIITGKWEGSDAQSGKTVATGPIISIRDPKWTSQTSRQDIPVMIFTLTQWNSLQLGEFHIGAAGVGPTELGRNSKYVFALPSRYNYAFPPGYQDVENILADNPLQPIN